jgi:hypothetical protein
VGLALAAPLPGSGMSLKSGDDGEAPPNPLPGVGGAIFYILPGVGPRQQPWERGAPTVSHHPVSLVKVDAV